MGLVWDAKNSTEGVARNWAQIGYAFHFELVEVLFDFENVGFLV